MSLILGIDTCKNITPPTYLSFFSASSSILISIVISVGNFLVVIAVIWNPYKDLRTPFNYFVANLSFADLVVGLILGPLSTIFHIFEGLDMLTHFDSQPFKDAVHVVYFTFCTASLFSLTALALDRYLAIMHPQSYRTHLNPVRALLISVLLWIVSILLSMIYFIVGYNRYRFIFANTAVAVTMIELIFTNAKPFEAFATTDASMGDLAREYRRELDHETVDDVGEKNDENTGHCNAVVSSFLSPIVCFYLHHQSLHRL